MPHQAVTFAEAMEFPTSKTSTFFGASSFAKCFFSKTRLTYANASSYDI